LPRHVGVIEQMINAIDMRRTVACLECREMCYGSVPGECPYRYQQTKKNNCDADYEYVITIGF
jgi:hypothetical protein